MIWSIPKIQLATLREFFVRAPAMESTNFCGHILLFSKIWYHTFFERTVLRTSTGTNQNFIIGCWYFLRKVQTTGMNQNFIICCWYFYLFVSLWHCSHVFVLPIEWWWFNIFLFFVSWGLGLLLCLKSNKHMGSDSLLSLMGNCHNFYLHECLSEFSGEWLEVWTRGFIKDDLINGKFIYINQPIGILVIRLSTCAAIIRVRAQLGILLLYFGDSVLEGGALAGVIRRLWK